MKWGVAVLGPSDRAGAATFHLQPPARSLEWLCGHRVRRRGNAAALSGQSGRFEVATRLLNTQEVRFEPKTARLTTQEVRFDVKRSFRLPKRQSTSSGMMKRSRKMKLEVADDLADRLAARLLEVQRENRRRFWQQLGYLLMLIGAVSGLITALAAIWEWLG